eukprot:TRINITY_DN3434_c0_g1_i1.p3 TRINITY_DN3434_c0_g1~~TRINITY_DN3434_c0_g1_i1.p3  ORF type:complete len:194 (-),score=-12.69 TRINITY_DN3434_c0_g1_i1:186-767(-)
MGKYITKMNLIVPTSLQLQHNIKKYQVTYLQQFLVAFQDQFYFFYILYRLQFFSFVFLLFLQHKQYIYIKPTGQFCTMQHYNITTFVFLFKSCIYGFLVVVKFFYLWVSYEVDKMLAKIEEFYNLMELFFVRFLFLILIVPQQQQFSQVEILTYNNMFIILYKSDQLSFFFDKSSQIIHNFPKFICQLFLLRI